MNETDWRGRLIMEMAARVGFGIANTGSTPTFRRPGYAQTIPDVTLASENILSKIIDWHVIENYTASDHQYIAFTWADKMTKQNQIIGKEDRWNVNHLKSEKLVQSFTELTSAAGGSGDGVVGRVLHALDEACKAAMPKKGLRGKKAVHWWNDEIKSRREECNKTRRKLTRSRRGNRHSPPADVEAYRMARKKLKIAIMNSKKCKWEELITDVNNNPWGLGYRVVMQKLGGSSVGGLLSAAEIGSIVDKLFPVHPVLSEDIAPPVGDVVPFSVGTSRRLHQPCKTKRRLVSMEYHTRSYPCIMTA